MELFKKGDKIGKYIVNAFIKKGALAESYTVYGGDDMLYFCKVFNLSDMEPSMLFEGKEVFEIVFSKELSAERNENRRPGHLLRHRQPDQGIPLPGDGVLPRSVAQRIGGERGRVRRGGCLADHPLCAERFEIHAFQGFIAQ